MTRVLLLSNGNGEDLSGALIGKQLQDLDFEIHALPIVGNGNAYKRSQIKIIGKTKEYSTGGLGYTTLRGRISELLQGQIIYLIRRLIKLLTSRSKYDFILVIGDIVPVFLAWFSGLPVLTYLVAYSSHYEGKLKLPWPCKNLLLSNRFLHIYTRDKLTADDLNKQLMNKVSFLGNPFMDPVLQANNKFSCVFNQVGLLPGSRRPELDRNILQMLNVIENLPQTTFEGKELSFAMALVPSMSFSDLRNLLRATRWKLTQNQNTVSGTQINFRNFKIDIYKNSFVNVLHSSEIFLCMAGTAVEQAAGLGKAIIQLEGKGPQFTASFAEAQRRLLGPALFCANDKKENVNTRNTAMLIFEALEISHNNTNLTNLFRDQAILRLGKVGGTKRMALSISNLISKTQKMQPI